MITLNQILQYNVTQTPWPLEDNSVDCCVTSPPYWGLRDYGVDGQLGMEHTPELYVANMVRVFDEVKRVLKPEGTLWLNLGDSYASNSKSRTKEQATAKTGLQGSIDTQTSILKQQNKIIGDLKPKDLVGIPWMVAFALRSAGWYLRQDIIWHKPNPMPESVTDRCTKSHEYIFLLSKCKAYYFDAAAIKTNSGRAGEKSYHDFNNPKYDAIVDDRWKDQFDGRNWGKEGYANKRSVWTIPSTPLPDAHFASFPEGLATPCVLAGCPKGGLILDPFMGAGTTAMVAKSHNRNYIGLELNPEYIKIAEARLSKAFGMFHT